MSVRTAVKSIQDILRQDAGVDGDGDAQRLSQLCWMFVLKIIDDQDQSLELTRDDFRSPIPEAFQWRTWAADPEGRTGDALLHFVNTLLFPHAQGAERQRWHHIPSARGTWRVRGRLQLKSGPS